MGNFVDGLELRWRESLDEELANLDGSLAGSEKEGSNTGLKREREKKERTLSLTQRSAPASMSICTIAR